MSSNNSPMKSPVMKPHDPNDDPFASLSAEMDANPLPLPTEYGSGAVDPTEHTDKEEEEEAEEEKTSPPASPKKTEETSPPKDEEQPKEE